MNNDAEELKKLMEERNRGMTMILVGVAVLLGVYVFGNLYATIKKAGKGSKKSSGRLMLKTNHEID